MAFPAVGSVWRKGSEWRRVIAPSIPGHVAFMTFGQQTIWSFRESDWHAWAADAVQVWPQPETPNATTPLELATFFHTTYETLAPHFGYETRPETQVFDQRTANGRLMIAVAEQVLAFMRPGTTPQPETPQPVGETVRIRIPVAVFDDGSFSAAGYGEMETLMQDCAGEEPVSFQFFEGDAILPKPIPTVTASVETPE